jgi:hypothetical protein
MPLYSTSLTHNNNNNNNNPTYLILLHDIIRPQMHAHHIRRIPPQPPLELSLIRDINRQEAGVALIIPIIFRVVAVILRLAGADEINGCKLGGLELLPEFRAPTDYLGDAVAEGHVADGCVGGLCGCGCCQGGEEEGGEVEHFGGWGGRFDVVLEEES